jgi:hypothetical protein
VALTVEAPSSSPRRNERSSAAIALAVLSLGAAALHFAFAPGHFDESTAHGAFFIAIGWAQLVTAVLLLSNPSRKVVLQILVLNAAVVGVWLLSRTVGVPIGPEAGEPEPVGLPDALATLFEVVLVLAMGWRLLDARANVSPRAARFGPLLSIGAVLLVIGGTSAALTPEFAGEHHHGGAEETAADGHTHSQDGTEATADGTGATGDSAAAAVAGHDHPVTAGLTGTTPCELSGPPASTAQVTDAEGHDHRGPFEQKPLTFEERQALKGQQEIARTVADKYPTVADAEAAGYRMSTPYVPCIGAHYTNTALVVGFNPATPSELLFDGTNPDSKLVGLSYLLYNPGGAPAGFAGPNDIWHQHNANGGLCFSNTNNVVIGGESMTEADCTARGGHKSELTDIWMLHDWIVPGWECTWGVFAAECPELGGRAGGTAWDPPASS